MSNLQTLEISLRNQNGPLPIQAVRLHVLRGVFYSALGGEGSERARALHSKGTDGRAEPAPYTVGPVFDDGYMTGIRITSMQDCARGRDNLGQTIAAAWDGLRGRVIRVGPANMKVLDVSVRAQRTYEQLWSGAGPNHGLQMRFEMPTRFSFNGYVEMLPVPRMLWHFYLLRWNRYSGLNSHIPREFPAWVEHQVHAVNVSLVTRMAYVEGTATAAGMMGDVTYQAYREKPPRGKQTIVPENQLPDYLRAWQALASLAEFCGTGDNATIGMGRTHIVSSFGAYQAPS